MSWKVPKFCRFGVLGKTREELRPIVHCNTLRNSLRILTNNLFLKSTSYKKIAVFSTFHSYS
jgi:hypothetical protein